MMFTTKHEHHKTAECPICGLRSHKMDCERDWHWDCFKPNPARWNTNIIDELAAAKAEAGRLREALREIADRSGETKIWDMATAALATEPETAVSHE